MKRINQFLHSEASILLVLALALLAQTPHTASVFHRLAAGELPFGISWVHAAFYAIALEFATLLFVVHGKRGLSWLFAGVSVLANVAYYWQSDMTIPYMASALLISLALPACIAFYSKATAILPVAQNIPAASIVPPSLDILPVVAKRKKVAQAPVSDDTAALEEMLEVVDMTGGQMTDMTTAWHNAFATFGGIGVADDIVAAQFGISKRTVIRKRTAGKWETAETQHRNGNGWQVTA